MWACRVRTGSADFGKLAEFHRQSGEWHDVSSDAAAAGDGDVSVSESRILSTVVRKRSARGALSFTASSPITDFDDHAGGERSGLHGWDPDGQREHVELVGALGGNGSRLRSDLDAATGARRHDTESGGGACGHRYHAHLQRQSYRLRAGAWTYTITQYRNWRCRGRRDRGRSTAAEPAVTAVSAARR